MAKYLRWLDGLLGPRMQRTSCGPRRVPLPLELVPVVRRVEHDTAGATRGLMGGARHRHIATHLPPKKEIELYPLGCIRQFWRNFGLLEELWELDGTFNFWTLMEYLWEKCGYWILSWAAPSWGEGGCSVNINGHFGKGITVH